MRLAPGLLGRAGAIAAALIMCFGTAARADQSESLTPDPGGASAGETIISANFEDGTTDGWVPRDNGTGAPRLLMATDMGQGGMWAVAVAARASQGSGIGLDVTGALTAGVTYSLAARLRFAPGEAPGDIWLSLETDTGATQAFATLGQFTGMSDSAWTDVFASFTLPQGDRSFLYFETKYEGAGVTGNTSSFMVDDIAIAAPQEAPLQALAPLKDTVTFPLGVAVDSRETTGASSKLLLRHFNQITPENAMKPEAWYDAAHQFSPSPEIASLMDFAAANDLRVYGHVLVWHSQIPQWFFEHDDGTPLTTSPADQQILEGRMHDHIFAVAKYLSDNWGAFGGGNPVVAFDVVNEAVVDGASDNLGMRPSEWYRVLGERYVDLAFQYADEAFNQMYAAPGAGRPVTLFINDYNTDQPAKRAVYLALIDRLLARGVPIDGIGHQFHVSLDIPVDNLARALDDSGGRGLVQAVTEMDVPTGTPPSDAKFLEQGYYYRDAFRVFRDHASELFSVTVWGLYDARSWRDDQGGPLVFDDALQAKPAYYGIVEGHSHEVPLSAFAGGAGSASRTPWLAGAAALAALAAGGVVWWRRRATRVAATRKAAAREGAAANAGAEVGGSADDALATLSSRLPPGGR